MKTIIFVVLCVFIAFADAIVVNSSLLDSKIVGGTHTSDAYKKFMTSLRIEGKHFCSGFLVSLRIAITTGFCAHYMILHGGHGFMNASAFVGNSDHSFIQPRHIVKIDHAKHHPSYDPDDPIGNGDHDIGYVLLENQLCRSKAIRTTKYLLRVKDLPLNSRVHIFGWGSEELENPPKKLSDVRMSTILKEIEIKISRAVPCQTILGRLLSENQVCGKGVNKGETAAQGDAGSPMVLSNSFLGITSIVNMIGDQNPIVFLNARPFRPYIENLKAEFPENKRCKKGSTDLPDLNEPLSIE